MSSLQHTIGHLETQFLNGMPVLFTGAGFSLDVLDVNGKSVPSTTALRAELSEIVWPGEPVDEENSLQDIFHVALQRKRNALIEHLRTRLTVAPRSVPEYYRTYFSVPWYRVYTLNIDDLEQAIATKFVLPAQPVSISAMRPLAPQDDRRAGPSIEVIHLNGTLDDIPDGITFSTMQYASRQGMPDPYYEALSAELLSRPVVFVGTDIDEDSLWRHVQMRALRRRESARELRCKSYIVTPSLSKARRGLLQDFNVVWLEMTADEFAAQVLEPIRLRTESHFGQAARLRAHRESSREPALTLVADEAARNPGKPTNFLIGQEPEWSDLICERAVRRNIDTEMHTAASTALNSHESSIILITGTAASGKSTGLMRLALSLANDGVQVAWHGMNDDTSIFDLVRLFRGSDGIPVVAIDDLGRLGDAVFSVLQELTSRSVPTLVLATLRAGGRADAVQRTLDKRLPVQRFGMPTLTDADIDGLIEVLAKHNRLGRLLTWPIDQQRRAFREQAGRQLLVAMIQATSGKRFNEKIEEEYAELQGAERLVYAITAVATGRGYALARQELLLATGELSNATLEALDKLLKYGILTRSTTDGNDLYAARHREIAAVLTESFSRQGTLWEIVRAVVFGVAATSPRVDYRSVRANRLLKAFLSHEYLGRITDKEHGRAVYEVCETALSHDFQYWLQRGAFELDAGEFELANLFLQNASALHADDPMVQTECYHLQLKVALRDPESPRSEHAVNTALDALERLVRDGRATGPHPCHLLGSQGLAWLRRSRVTAENRLAMMRRLKEVVEFGASQHPLSEELQQLAKDLGRELLSLHSNK